MNLTWTNEQTSAINSNKREIVVSAAAGSGKTAVLSERIISKIKNGSSLRRLLVLTFTVKAANEMKERIYKKLIQLPKNDHIEKQIDLFSTCNISTLHSFCKNLISNYFYLLDISPNFDLADENKLAIIRADCVDKILQQASKQNSPTFRKLVDNFGGKQDEKIAELILELYDFSMASANPIETLNKRLNINDAANEIIQNANSHLENIVKKYDKIIELCQANVGFEFYLPILQNEQKMFETSNTWNALKSNFNQIVFSTLPGKGEKDKEIAKEIQGIRNNVKDKIKEYQGVFESNFEDLQAEASAMIPQLDELINLVTKFSEEYKKEKLSNNFLDYYDLEHLTIELLQNNPKEIAQNFDEIYIDEFQDTNSAQATIYSLLSEHINIFAVGDVKQSIYAFRNANPQIFLDYCQEKSSRDYIKLSHNFRSEKDIIQGINKVFNKIFSKKVGGVEYSNEHKLIFPQGKESKIIEEPIELHIIYKNSSEETLVANKIIELANQGFKLSEIAILAIDNATCRKFAQTIGKANIPYIVEEKSGFFKAIEISSILSLLKVIDNYLDEISLISALRSPLFGWSDNQLAEARLRIPNANFFETIKEEEAIDVIFDFIEFAKTNSISDLLEYIFYKTNYENKISQTGNLQLLRKYAADFEKGEYKSLREFTDYITECIDNKKDFAIFRASSNSDDAVQILTIHKSKGLEFKVVFLVGTQKRFRFEENKNRILFDHDRGISCDYVDFNERIVKPSITNLAIKKAKHDLEVSEKMRVLYVALTRAKEKIIITGQIFNIEKKLEEWRTMGSDDILESNNFLDWLGFAVIKKHLHEEETIELQTIEIEQNLENKNNINRLEKMIEYSHSLTKTSVTKMINEDVKEEIVYMPGKGSTAKRGTIVHFVMQSLDLSKVSSAEEINQQIQNMITLKMLTEEEAKEVKVDKIFEFFQSSLGKRLLKSDNIKRELKFIIDLPCGNNENILVQGVIDCAFIENNEAIIIDFKTGEKAQNKPQSKKQVEIYSLALEKMLNIKVAESHVYSGL